MSDTYPYTYAWGNNPVRASFKGLRCRMICKGAMNSCLVEFEDGRRTVTSVRALRLRRTYDVSYADRLFTL